MLAPSLLLLIGIGLGAGVLSGIFGIGGGVVIVPALMYFAGFSPHLATGTSLAILLPPIGLAAVFEYHRHGHVNLRAALVIALCMALGGWIGAIAASRADTWSMRVAFAVFVLLLGASLLVSALRQPSS
jgi:uncharacterized membrane protein YfcA